LKITEVDIPSNYISSVTLIVQFRFLHSFRECHEWFAAFIAWAGKHAASFAVIVAFIASQRPHACERFPLNHPSTPRWTQPFFDVFRMSRSGIEPSLSAFPVQAHLTVGLSG